VRATFLILCWNKTVRKNVLWSKIPDDELDLAQIFLPEDSKQIAHQQNHQHCAKPYAGTSAGAPSVVAVVASATAEDKHQNNNQNNDEHFISSCALGYTKL